MDDGVLHGPVAFVGRAARADAMFPLRVSDLCLELGGKRILHGLDLALGPRGCTVILGPNGAGKSQLIRLLHGLVQPSSGVIDWNGRSPGEVTERQAMVFQRPVLLRRSVAANVEFVLRARGLPMERRDALLEHVGLLHKTHQPARLLSGGEAQRLALARALATQPEVLFLDEPTASLDPASVSRIEQIVHQAVAQGTRVLFVTHDIGQARRIGDDVVFLHGGRVQEHAPVTSFFPRPQTAAARAHVSGGLVF